MKLLFPPRFHIWTLKALPIAVQQTLLFCVKLIYVCITSSSPSFEDFGTHPALPHVFMSCIPPMCARSVVRFWNPRRKGIYLCLGLPLLFVMFPYQQRGSPKLDVCSLFISEEVFKILMCVNSCYWFCFVLSRDIWQPQVGWKYTELTTYRKDGLKGSDPSILPQEEWQWIKVAEYWIEVIWSFRYSILEL